MIERGAKPTVSVEKFGDKGKSIARIDNFTIMVNGGVPGDDLVVEIRRKKRRYAEADIVEIVNPSKLRTQPRCFHFGTCGGCKWQHVDYDAQLDAKTESVHDALTRLGGVADARVRRAIGATDIYAYRNKMEYSFSSRRWLTREEIASGIRFEESVAAGFHVSGNYEKVLDIQECHLQVPVSYEILHSVRSMSREGGWTAWDVRNHTGYLRHLVVRTSNATGDVMVNLVTDSHDAKRNEAISAMLRDKFPHVSTFVNTINTGVAQTSYGEETLLVFGSGTIVDTIGKYSFEISPHSFFQTNTAQAETLYEVVRETAQLKPSDHIYDLYCGAGTISLFLSSHVERVTGVEVIRSAVDDAIANAAMNGVDNCEFVEGDMLKILNDEFLDEHGRPDVVVVDPPRAGMHPKVVKRLARIRPEKLVYVSCNPRTQARDIELLGGGFRVGESQPVDMFPHTHHIENVVLLTPDGN